MLGRKANAKRRRCPKCRVPMWPFDLHDVQVDLCQKCRGMWFDRGELAKASGTTYGDGASSERLLGARQTLSTCPDCALPLRERELTADSGVMIDQCPGCLGLFLDQGEYSAAQIYLRSKKWRQASKREPQPDMRVINEDSIGLVVLQYLTGLPLEMYVHQRLWSPAVTVFILANVAVFVLAHIFGFDEYVKQLALVPAEAASGGRLHTLLTSTFMHGGVFHLLGNMYFLFVTGDNVEERFGLFWFPVFYILCGLAASVAHVAGHAGSAVPCIGASGAISGVLGAYVVLFPHNRFLVRWLIVLRPVRFEIPAYAYFGLWVLLQVVYASLKIPGVAWWAHIGGFACGAAIAVAVRARERRKDAMWPSPVREARQ